jgi:hypothetical protein
VYTARTQQAPARQRARARTAEAATSVIAPPWPASSSTQSPISMSQTRAVPSVDTVMMSTPPGVSSTLTMPAACPRSVSRRSPPACARRAAGWAGRA